MPTIDTERMRIIDLEFPRTAGMPEFPTHKPAYAFTLYHRHDDALGTGGRATSPPARWRGAQQRLRTAARYRTCRNTYRRT